MTQLALDYRPRTFKEVVGQKHVSVVLKAIVRSGDVPAALILAGSRGTGKTTMARIFAASLNCPDRDDADPCAECPSCLSVQIGASMSVLEIDAASNGLVDDIRKLKDVVSYSHEGMWRVVLLDEAHSMSREAFNALLKILEEPPPNTCFVMLTTESNKILPTVRSRSMSFDFRRHTVEDIVGHLRKIRDEREIEVTDDLIDEVAVRAEGGMRDAVMALDQLQRAGVGTVDEYRESFGLTDVSEPLLEAITTGDLSAGNQILDDHFRRSGDAGQLVADLTSCVRDLLVLKSGGTIHARQAERERLAGRFTQDKLTSCIKILWDLKGRTRHVDADQRTTTEMAFVLLCEAMSDRVPIQNGNGHGRVQKTKPMSLEQMRTVASGG